jgi:hypothetical protein
MAGRDRPYLFEASMAKLCAPDPDEQLPLDDPTDVVAIPAAIAS